MSLKVKITASVVIVLLVATGALSKLGLAKITDLVVTEKGLRAKGLALALARLIEPGWLEQLDPTDPQQLATRPYRQLLDEVRQTVLDNNIFQVQIVKFINGRQIQYVFDSRPPDDPDFGGPGAIKDIIEAPVYFLKTADYHWLVLEQAGTFMGGWAPVGDKGGPHVGTVLVVFDASPTSRALNSIGFFLIALSALFSALAGFTAYRFSTTFERIAITDGLMGIVNHKHFKQRLEVECNRAGRYNLPLSLIMLDIDHFKKVNDTYGHAVGDVVLRHLARWVREASRNTDLVARYGGEEVAVILPHTGLAGAQEFAERVRLKVANEWVKDPDEDVTLRITISLGVAQYQRGLSMIDLVKRADAALYQSKHNGRNRVTIWTEDLMQAPAEATPPGQPVKV